MAKAPTVPRAENFDTALAALVNLRARREATAAQVETLTQSLDATRQQLADMDRDIAARAQALRAGFAKSDFFEWAAKAPA